MSSGYAARRPHASKAERAEWVADLRETLPPGSTLYTVIRGVARSGMSRSMDAYAMDGEIDGRIARQWLSYRLAAVNGYGWDVKRECLRLSGCGMDMGYWLCYSVSSMLYPQGFDCIGQRCPSNDHSNGDRDYSPHHHRDGGYALRHEWI